MKTTRKSNDNGGFHILRLMEKRGKCKFSKPLVKIWLLAVKSGETEIAELAEELRKRAPKR